MTTAKCNRCGASADAGTFEEASLLLNHAVGLSRGIPCGDNYNSVVEVVVENTPDTIAAPKEPKTDEGSWKHVEGKSNENVEFDEAKQSAKKKFK